MGINEQRKHRERLVEMQGELRRMQPTPQNVHNCLEVLNSLFIEYLGDHVKYLDEHIAADQGG